MLEAARDSSLIIPCPKCGARNRIDETRIYDSPICGRCRHPLSESAAPAGTVLPIDDHSFEMVALYTDKPLVVDCWAPGCSPCKKIEPVLATLAGRYAGRVNIMNLDVEENPMTVKKFSVQNIPTLLFLKNGQLVNTITGEAPMEEIERQMLAIL